MTNPWVAILGSTVLGAVVTGLLTYLTTIRKVRRDLEADYDRDLRMQRIASYAELWMQTQLLARYSPPGAVTPAACQQLVRQLRRWYYESGGMYLSERARDLLFELMNGLQRVAPDGASPYESRERYKQVDEFTFEFLRSRASTLRTQIVADVGTRNPPLLLKRSSNSGS